MDQNCGNCKHLVDGVCQPLTNNSRYDLIEISAWVEEKHVAKPEGRAVFSVEPEPEFCCILWEKNASHPNH